MIDRTDQAAAIKASVELVDYVARTVALKRRGGRFWGLCPFHAEKTPSFSVHRRGFFKCFGCGAGGDLFTFVRLAEGLTFAEACERLAGDYGIDAVPSAAEREARRRRRAELERDERTEKRQRGEAAIEIWRRSRRGIVGTVVEAYLEGRGIRRERLPDAAWPPTLRWLEAHKYVHAGDPASGQSFPVMVAAVQRETLGLDRAPVVAIHRTYIAADGSGKAAVQVPKKMLGAFSGGAIRLAPARREVAIAEGIETALTVLAERPALSVWAAGSLEGLAAVLWPPGVRRVRLMMDSDTKDPAVGERIIIKARARYGSRGAAVSVARAAPGKDFNDMIEGAA